MVLQQVAQTYFKEPGFRHMQGGYYGPGRLIGPLIFLLLVLVGMLLAYKAFTKHHIVSAPRQPLDIAKERYAKGEISKEELADIKKELKN
ncbi:MAG TPA: SHOCT domain-containing protein [Candidatus Saccharimonadales bacterium]|nr:SHOCT domain-containing protein [Candidatus Saccharimonadales bacterium]